MEGMIVIMDLPSATTHNASNGSLESSSTPAQLTVNNSVSVDDHAMTDKCILD